MAPDQKGSRARPTPALRAAGTVSVPGAKLFVADDHLSPDHLSPNGNPATTRIAFVWTAFMDEFLPKVEEDVPPAELTLYDLTKPSVDAEIITELDDTYETYLADLSALLRMQDSGEDGPLLTNGLANIFYIRAKDRSLWAVYAHWFLGREGWYLNAYSVENPFRQNQWHAGRRVVSR
jgi:hypothetical protein